MTVGPAPTTAPLTLDSARGRWLLLAAVLGSALAGIDATVVNVALPDLAADLDADFAVLQWTVSAYALTLAAFVLVGGVLGDRFGRRRVFLIGVVWFAVASLACGLAPDAGTLIAARGLQGVGAALLTPGSLAMIQAAFVGHDRARAIGAWSGLGGVATAIGPFLGGWLVDVASWRWVFLVNVPLAAVVVVVALRHVPESRDPAAHGRIDVAGAALGVLALGGLTYALVAAGGEAPARPVLLAVAVGLLAASALVVVERRAAQPLLPLHLLAHRQLLAANAVTLVVYGGFGAIFLLLVLQLQVVSGYGPVAAGSAMLPVTVLMLVLSPRAGALAERVGPRLPMSLGPVLVAAGLLLMLRIGPDADYLGDVLPGVVVLGLGLSLLVSPLTATALAAAPDGNAGLASGLNNAVARTAGLLAVAAVPVVAGLTGRVAEQPAAFDAGFGTALWICAATVLSGGVLAAVTIRDDVLAEREEPGTPDLAGRSEVRHLRHCGGIGAPPATTRVAADGRADCDGVPWSTVTSDCTHLDRLEGARPTTPAGCEECLARGGRWVHLRICHGCGHVGCCDSSPGRHATAHHAQSQHPLVRSYEPGEDWYYCYADDVAFEADGAPPAPSHP